MGKEKHKKFKRDINLSRLSSKPQRPPLLESGIQELGEGVVITLDHTEKSVKTLVETMEGIFGKI